MTLTVEAPLSDGVISPSLVLRDTVIKMGEWEQEGSAEVNWERVLERRKQEKKGGGDQALEDTIVKKNCFCFFFEKYFWVVGCIFLKKFDFVHIHLALKRWEVNDTNW